MKLDDYARRVNRLVKIASFNNGNNLSMVAERCGVTPSTANGWSKKGPYPETENILALDQLNRETLLQIVKKEKLTDSERNYLRESLSDLKEEIASSTKLYDDLITALLVR